MSDEKNDVGNDIYTRYIAQESALKAAQARADRAEAEVARDRISAAVRSAAAQAGVSEAALPDVVELLSPRLRVEGGWVSLRGDSAADPAEFIGQWLDARPHLKARGSSAPVMAHAPITGLAGPVQPALATSPVAMPLRHPDAVGREKATADMHANLRKRRGIGQ